MSSTAVLSNPAAAFMWQETAIGQDAKLQQARRALAQQHGTVARELLQQTDRLIKTIPEVDLVFGKVGRADTATDPAPLTMIETMIKLKPQDQWRADMTLAKIKALLDSTVQIPGIRNAWLMPIQARINMQSTGINTPIGIKISGAELDTLQTLGTKIESISPSIRSNPSIPQ